MDETIEVYERAINTYGTEAQIDQAIEEMAELTQALIKRRRHWNAYGSYSGDIQENISEEMADVTIMIEQLSMIFENDNDVIRFRIEKINRLKERIGG